LRGNFEMDGGFILACAPIPGPLKFKKGRHMMIRHTGYNNVFVMCLCTLIFLPQPAKADTNIVSAENKPAAHHIADFLVSEDGNVLLHKANTALSLKTAGAAPRGAGYINSELWLDRGVMQEWWRPVGGGAQQGFLLHSMPTSGCISVQVRGGLGVMESARAGFVELLNANGERVATYGGLVSWDARGVLLPSTLRASADGVELCVDTAGASWPVTIDPLVTYDVEITPALSQVTTYFRFGRSLAAADQWLAVGEANDATDDVTRGAVHMYERNGASDTNWIWRQELVNPSRRNFADKIAMDKKFLLVSTTEEGAHMYTRAASSMWQMDQWLALPSSFENTIHRAEFVDASGDVAVCGEWAFVAASAARVVNKATGQGSDNVGAIMAYYRNSSATQPQWVATQVFTPTTTAAQTQFGQAVSCYGDWMAIGAPQDQRGSVSVYRRDNATNIWSFQQKINYTGTSIMSNILFGYDISVYENKMLIGAPFDEHPTSSALTEGGAYMYELSKVQDVWSLIHTFHPSIQQLVQGADANYGLSVAIKNKTILIGSPRGGGVNSEGEVYMYQPDGSGNWTETLWRNSARQDERLGLSVLLHGTSAFAGAPTYRSITPRSGAAYVRGINTAPLARDQQVMTLENETVRFGADAEDNETGAVTLQIIQPPTRGLLRIVGAEFEYIPEQGQVYQTQFSYKVSDGVLESQPALITIQVVDSNDAPVATPQQLTTSEDTRLSLTLSGADPDGDPLVLFEVVRAPRRGMLTGAGAMRTYIPGSEVSGDDSFTFKVSDGVAESQEAEVRITVTPVDDPPVFVAPLHEGVTRSEDGAKVDLTFAAMDVDSSNLTWSATELPQGASFSSGRLEWTPTADQRGMHTIKISISDASTTVSLTKQIFVVFLDANSNGVPDISERALVSTLGARGDEDGDGIRNFEEIGDAMAPNDTDRDGTLDVLDADSDNDGISDKVEAGDSDLLTPPVDSDGNGTPDFQQTDADGDGIDDGQDNCRRVKNTDQRDDDGNDIGDACDGDDELPFVPNKPSDEGGCQHGSGNAPGGLMWILVTALAFMRRTNFKRLMLMASILFAVSGFGCVESEQIEQEKTSIRTTKQKICGVCVPGTWCDANGNIQNCVADVNGCGQVQSTQSCTSGQWCHAGACVVPPAMTTPPQMGDGQASLLGNNGVAWGELEYIDEVSSNYSPIFPTNGDINKIQVIPYEAFIYAMAGRDFKEVSSAWQQKAQYLSEQANNPDVGGITAVYTEGSQNFEGNLFFVTLDAAKSPMAALPSTVPLMESRFYFIAAVELKGYTPWLGTFGKMHAFNELTTYSGKTNNACPCGVSGLGPSGGCGFNPADGPEPHCDSVSCPGNISAITINPNLQVPMYGSPDVVSVDWGNGNPQYTSDMTVRVNNHPSVSLNVYSDREFAVYKPSTPRLNNLFLAPVGLPTPVFNPSICNECVTSTPCVDDGNSFGAPGDPLNPVRLPHDDCNVSNQHVPELCTQISSFEATSMGPCAWGNPSDWSHSPYGPESFCVGPSSPRTAEVCGTNHGRPGYCNFVTAQPGSPCDGVDHRIKDFYIGLLGCKNGDSSLSGGVTCEGGAACVERNNVKFCTAVDENGNGFEFFERDLFDERIINTAEEDLTRTLIVIEAAGYGVYNCGEISSGIAAGCTAPDGTRVCGQYQDVKSCNNNIVNHFINNVFPTSLNEGDPDKDNNTPNRPNNPKPNDDADVFVKESNKKPLVAERQKTEDTAAKVKKTERASKKKGSGKAVEKSPDSPKGDGPEKVADPVLAHSGEQYIHHTDLSFPGPVRPLTFERYYSSQSNNRSTLGSNWSSNFDLWIEPITSENKPDWAAGYCHTLAPLTSCAIVHYPDGREQLFAWDIGAQDQLRVIMFMPVGGGTDTLYKHADGLWSLRSSQGHVQTFDAHGALFSDYDRFGNGFTIYNEPTPTYALYSRYCKSPYYSITTPRFISPGLDFSTISNPVSPDYFQSTSHDKNFCRALGHTLGMVSDIDVSISAGYPNVNIPFEPEEKNFEPGYTELVEGLGVGAYKDRIKTSRGWSKTFFGSNILPQAPWGKRRMRPTKARDNLGREIAFVYESNPEDKTFGLLKAISGPAKTHVAFQYKNFESNGFPTRLNERFLSRVHRFDDNQTHPLDEAPERSQDFEYAWERAEIKNLVLSEYANNLYNKYFDYYTKTNGCRVGGGAGGTSCGGDHGQTGICRGIDMVYGPAIGLNFCMGGGTTISGNPCVMAMLDKDQYLSDVADNITKISRHKTVHSGVSAIVEVESRFDINPLSQNFDRVTTQRYGGLPHAQYAQYGQPPLGVGNNWDTTYPEYKLSYISSGPTTYSLYSQNQVTTDATTLSFLPQAILARYPLENISNKPHALQNSYAGLAAPELAYDPAVNGAKECVGTQYRTINSVANSPQEYAPLTCRPQAARLAKRNLPGWRPLVGYYSLRDNSQQYVAGEGPDKIVRTRLTCEQLAEAQTRDVTMNGLIMTAVAPSGKELYECVQVPKKDANGNIIVPNQMVTECGVPENTRWVHSEQAREELEDNARRVCAWTKLEDRDGRVVYLGTNYRGQTLTRVVPNDSGSALLFHERFYNADGSLVEERAVAAEGPQLSVIGPVPGSTRYVYEDIIPNCDKNDLHNCDTEWTPLWWTRRENLLRIESYPLQPSRDHAWRPSAQDLGNPSSRTLDSELSYARVMEFEHEMLFNQPLRVETFTVTAQNALSTVGSQSIAGISGVRSTSKTTYDYDYMELNGTESNGSLCRFLTDHVKWGFPFFGTATGSNPANIQVTCAAAMLDLVNIGFLNKDINGDGVIGSPAAPTFPARRVLGLPIRTISHNVNNAADKIHTWTAYSSNGMPIRVLSEHGGEIRMQYYSLGAGAQYGYTGNDAVFSASSYGNRGMLAVTETRRFAKSYEHTLSPPLANGATPCAALPIAYRWLLPAGCPNGLQTALTSIGLPAELITALQTEGTASNALNTNGWNKVQLRYSEAGHISEQWVNGSVTRNVHDSDGRIQHVESHLGIQTTYKRHLDGWPAEISVSDSNNGQMLFHKKFDYDAEGRVLAECISLSQTMACINAIEGQVGGSVSFDENRPVDNPDYLLTTYRYTPEGLPWKTMSPSKVITYNGYTARNLVATQRVETTGGKRAVHYAYNMYGALMSKVYDSSEPQAATPPQESFFYDGWLRPTQFVDARGASWWQAHNEYGSVSASKYDPVSGYGSSYTPAAHEMLYAHDSRGRPSATNEYGIAVSQTHWGAHGLVEGASRTGQGTVWVNNDASGMPVWSLDAAGNQQFSLSTIDRKHYSVTLRANSQLSGGFPASYLATTTVTEFDEDSRPTVTRTFGAGTALAPGDIVESSVETNGLGQVIVAYSPEGTITSIERNLAGWPTTVVKNKQRDNAGDVDTLAYAYNASGQIIAAQDYRASGSEWTTRTYNPFGELQSTYHPTDAQQAHESFTYDGIGRPLTRSVRKGSNQSAYTLSYNYNGLGDMVSLGLVGQGELQQFTYDALGRTTQSVDTNLALRQLGIINYMTQVNYVWDAASRLTQEEQLFVDLQGNPQSNSLSTISNYDVNVNGWMREVEYPSGQVVSRQQDLIGRLKGVTMPNSRTLTQHWMGGLPTGRDQSISTNVNASPLRERRTYDSLGRLATLDYRAVDLSSNGQPVNAAWGQSYCKGTWGSACAAPLAHLEFKRDLMGRVVSRHHKFGHVFRNSNNALVAPTSRRSSWAGYAYNGQGHLVGEWQSGSMTLAQHQSLPSHALEIESELDSIIGSGDSALSWERETHVGGLKRIIDRNTQFVHWQHNNTAGVMAERGVGHRALQIELPERTFNVEHDGQGRVQTDGRHDYYYDVLGRLVGAFRDDACSAQENCIPNSQLVQEYYIYDTSNRLVRVGSGKSVGDEPKIITTFAYDGAQMIAAYDGPETTNLSWEAVWGGSLDELVWWGPNLSARGHAVIRDGRNSPLMTWDEQARAPSALWEYSAMGRAKLWDLGEQNILCQEEGTGDICTPTLSEMAFPFGFNMAWRSPRTGLSNMRARWYSAEMGQFMSHDPLGFIDSTNMYGFASFDPINGWDPWGLKNQSLGKVGGEVLDGIDSVFDGIATEAVAAAAEVYGNGGVVIDSDLAMKMAAAKRDALRKQAEKAWEDYVNEKEPGDWFNQYVNPLTPLAEAIGTIVGGGSGKQLGQVVGNTGLGIAMGPIGKYVPNIRLPGSKGKGPGSNDGGPGNNTQKPDNSPESAGQCSGGKCALLHCSFPAETLVEMCDGTKKPISEIELGEFVLSQNDKTGEKSCQPVTMLHRHADSVVYELLLERENGQTEALIATDDHPIWIIGVGWVDAGKLGLFEDSALLDASNKPVRLIGHKLLTITEDVFNLSVWSDESFFVGEGSYWVHNCEKWDNDHTPTRFARYGKDTEKVTIIKKGEEIEVTRQDIFYAEVENGVLKMAVETPLKNIYAGRSFREAMAHFQQHGTDFHTFIAEWNDSTPGMNVDPTNFENFHKALGNGTPWQDAVADTWTGRMMESIGMYPTDYVIKDSAVNVTFNRR
jgi:RHS repeat-associated protein